MIVEPEVPENTGFIARLASNFSFSMRLVNPGFNLEESRRTASRAQEKLREAEIFDSMETALEDLDYVVGTKPGRGTSIENFEPRENTSLVIGRESSGLTNEELNLCDAVIHIQTSGYESLNQSHAAAILMHSFHAESSVTGIKPGQKQVLEEMAGEYLGDMILRANPSRGEIDRLIGELRELQNR